MKKWTRFTDTVYPVNKKSRIVNLYMLLKMWNVDLQEAEDIMRRAYKRDKYNDIPKEWTFDDYLNYQRSIVADIMGFNQYC